jgi:hypothetical protein
MASIVASHPGLFDHPKLAGGLAAYAGIQSALWDTPVTDLLRGASFGPSRRLDTYLDSLGARPTARRADLAGVASFAVSGLMAGEALLTPDLDLDELDVLGAEADEDIATPWRQGQASLQTELYRELRQINPAVPDLLKGAWEDIVRDGPAAVSKVANCLTEAIDWTLRSICEGVDLAAWLGEQGLKGGRYLDGRGRPTVTARAMYAVRSRSRRDRRLVVSLEEGVVAQLVALRDAVEGHKHGGAVVTVLASGIRSHAASAEALLAALLGL